MRGTWPSPRARKASEKGDAQLSPEEGREQPGKKGGGLCRLQEYEVPGCLQPVLRTNSTCHKGPKAPWRTIDHEHA